MSSTTLWLGRLAVVLIVMALTGGGTLLFGWDDSPGRRWLSEHQRVLDRKLHFLRAPVNARRVLLCQAALVVLSTVAALTEGEALLLTVALPALVLPGLQVERLLARRATQVEEQIEPWLNAVANSLRAIPSLGEAIASSVSLVPAPMSQEVDVLVKEYELGTPLDRALDHLAERIPSKTLSGTILALKVARRSGGNLPEMLESAAIALRELARLEGVVRTKTAEGKAQAVVIGAIPVPLIALVQYSDPHFFEPLVSTFAGQLVIAAACVLWVIAVAMARKILQVDV